MAEEFDDKAKFKLLLKSERIKLKNSDGDYVFVIPEKIYNDVIDQCKFSLDQLMVGGDIPLPDLAKHIDEQSAWEARIGFMAETVRYQWECAKDEFENWWEKTSYEVREVYIEEVGKPPTEKTISNCIHSQHGDEYLALSSKCKKLEYKYRLFNHVIRAAIVTKGTLLPTLRNIIQGNNSEGIGIHFEKKTGRKVKVK
jgi:hypothetical protein